MLIITVFFGAIFGLGAYGTIVAAIDGTGWCALATAFFLMFHLDDLRYMSWGERVGRVLSVFGLSAFVLGVGWILTFKANVSTTWLPDWPVWFSGGAGVGAVIGGLETWRPGILMRRWTRFEALMKEREYWW